LNFIKNSTICLKAIKRRPTTIQAAPNNRFHTLSQNQATPMNKANWVLFQIVPQLRKKEI